MATLNSSLVVALNPSIDAEWHADDVQWEEKNSIKSERRWAGGKGVNVARWLKHLGQKPRLVLPTGGITGKEMIQFLNSDRLRMLKVAIQEPTRVNVIITTNRGKQLRFNPPGPTLSSSEWDKLFKSVAKELETHQLMILSGSLPRSAAPDTYARLITIAKRLGRRTILDCDGPALTAAIPARPFLVKPNEVELAQWRKRPIKSGKDLFEAACLMSRQTKGWVFVSRGADGAILVNEAEKVYFEAKPPIVDAINTVGAGDALVAALAFHFVEGTKPQEWLRSGVATGTAATQYPPGKLPSRRLIERIAKQVSVIRHL